MTTLESTRIKIKQTPQLHNYSGTRTLTFSSSSLIFLFFIYKPNQPIHSFSGYSQTSTSGIAETCLQHLFPSSLSPLPISLLQASPRCRATSNSNLQYPSPPPNGRRSNNNNNRGMFRIRAFTIWLHARRCMRFWEFVSLRPTRK